MTRQTKTDDAPSISFRIRRRPTSDGGRPICDWIVEINGADRAQFVSEAIPRIRRRGFRLQDLDGRDLSPRIFDKKDFGAAVNARLKSIPTEHERKILQDCDIATYKAELDAAIAGATERHVARHFGLLYDIARRLVDGDTLGALAAARTTVKLCALNDDAAAYERETCRHSDAGYRGKKFAAERNRAAAAGAQESRP
jgi:hypothetical protein